MQILSDLFLRTYRLSDNVLPAGILEDKAVSTSPPTVARTYATFEAESLQLAREWTLCSDRVLRERMCEWSVPSKQPVQHLGLEKQGAWRDQVSNQFSPSGFLP